MQEAQDEDTEVSVLPGGDPDAGMPATEADIHGIEDRNTRYHKTPVYQRALTTSMKKARLMMTAVTLTVNIFR